MLLNPFLLSTAVARGAKGIAGAVCRAWLR